MKILYLLSGLLVVSIVTLQSCSIGGDEDDCELTGSPITNESLSTQFDSNGNFEFIPVA